MDEYGPNRMLRDQRYKYIARYPYGDVYKRQVKRLYEDLNCPAFALDGALDLLRTGLKDGRGGHDFSEAAAVMRDYLEL